MYTRQLVFVLTAAAVVSLSTSRMAEAQCEQPNGNDTTPDDASIQCLLDQGGTIVLNADVSMGYFINEGLVLRRSGTTFTSSSGGGNRALLRATSTLSSRMLEVESGAVTGYTISKIWFYGSRFDRTNPNCSGDNSVNLYLRGSGWLIDDIESDAVPCNSSTVVDGSTTHDFEIRNSWFANNGWGENERSGQWADGLTVQACVDGYVHDNNFRDNTDVNLVVGGGSNCRIEFNDIDNTLSYAFAGIHVGWFPGDGDGDHAGNIYRFNTISSGLNKMAFGLVLGLHPWNHQQADQVSNAGSTTGNNSTGAVVNLAIDGITGGNFSGNSGPGSRGTNGYGACSLASDYTAGDFGGASIQAGWVPRIYHGGTCQ
jgi:hypothetical protein